MRTERVGKKDLYVSFWQEDKNTWSVPKNLGPTLNTVTSESAPFLAADGRTLYFSSKGHPGYGSQDIYVTTRLDDSWENWTQPQNLGSIINTPNYDSYYTLPASGNYAYFTRYTQPKGGHSEIYRVKLAQAQKPDPVVLLSGKVINAVTKAPLEAAILYESLRSKEQLGVAQSNQETGLYKIVLPAGDAYGFLAEADGYIAINQNMDLTELDDYEERTLDLELIPIEKGQTIRLNNVFFETSRYNLKEAATLELDRLVDLLERYPKMQIEIAGHTDSKGGADYNKTLSQNRAKAVYDFLLKNNIPQKRIEYKGYGEDAPIADNETEKGRAENRRVEFKIIRIR